MSSIDITIYVEKPFVNSIAISSSTVYKTIEDNSVITFDSEKDTEIILTYSTYFNNMSNRYTTLNNSAGAIQQLSPYTLRKVKLSKIKSGVLDLVFYPDTIYYKKIPSGYYYLSDNTDIPSYVYSEGVNKECLFQFTDENLTNYLGIRIYNSDDTITGISFIDGNFKEIEVATYNKTTGKLDYVDTFYKKIRVYKNWNSGCAVDNDLYSFILQTNFFVRSTTISIKLYSTPLERKNVVKVALNELANSKFYITTVIGTLRESTSVTNFVVTMQYPYTPDFNYVYISELKRFYYVTDIELIKAGLYSISLSVDVLGTYQNGILELTAFVDRNENTYNSLVVDNKTPLQQGETVTVLEPIENKLFVDNTGSYLVQGIGISVGDKINE